jgi:hypothetical protein
MVGSARLSGDGATLRKAAFAYPEAARSQVLIDAKG